MPGHKPPKRAARPDNFDNVPDFSDDATHVSPPHPLQRESAKKTAAAATTTSSKGKPLTGKKPSKPKWLHRVATSKKAALDPAEAESADAVVPAGPQLDGQGLPYQTLAQLLKQHGLADTGGAAKHLVRAGGITVNGADELRPGRKLHHGDVVMVGYQTLQVVILPD
jgi:ribosome-associated protein